MASPPPASRVKVVVAAGSIPGQAGARGAGRPESLAAPREKSSRPSLQARGASARRCEEPAGMASASHRPLVAGSTTTIFLDDVARRGILFCC